MRARLVDLASRRRPELRLRLSAEAARRRRRHECLPCASVPIARWSFVPRIAAVIDAVTSPSWMSLMRAPAARISSTRSWWRGRSSTIAVMSFVFRPNAPAIALVVADLALQIDAAARGRPDGHLPHIRVRKLRKCLCRPRRSSPSRRNRRARRRSGPRVDRRRGRRRGRPGRRSTRSRAPRHRRRSHDHMTLDGEPVERVRHPGHRRLLGGPDIAAAEPPTAGEGGLLRRGRKELTGAEDAVLELAPPARARPRSAPPPRERVE